MEGLNELWRLVNTAETHEEIARAEHIIRINDVDNGTFDELMEALAYKSREAYRRDQGFDE